MDEMVTYELAEDLVNDTSRKLGFKMGGYVRLAKMFFANHGQKYQDIGIGVVYGKQMPDNNNLPHIIVQFPVCAEIFSNKLLYDMLFIRAQQGRSEKVLMSIHPMYLEKVEVKHAKGSGKKSAK